MRATSADSDGCVPPSAEFLEVDTTARRATSTIPFDPGRLPFFYGWIIVLVSTVGILASLPGQTNGVSVFTDHLLDATGLSRVQFSSAYLIGTVTSGLLLPLGGRWIDRYGARVVSLGAILGLAATVTILSFVDRLIDGVVGLVDARGMVGLIVLSVCFACLRFSGQGMLTLSSRTMLARWFERRRGAVAAGAGALMSFGFSVAPALLLALIGATDWRVAWRLIAVGLVVVMGSLVFATYRDSPESCGLLPDGRSPGSDDPEPGVDEAKADESALTTLNATRAEAVRSTSFWAVTLGIASLSVVSTALTFHIIDIGSEMGLDKAESVEIFVPIALVSVVVGLLVGPLIDRAPILRMVQLMCVMQLAMYVLTTRLGDPTFRLFAIVFWGSASGFYGPMSIAALPRLFGRLHLGAISSVQSSAMVIGSAIGPAFFAFIESRSGSYQNALLWSCVMPIAVIVLCAIPDRQVSVSAP